MKYRLLIAVLLTISGLGGVQAQDNAPEYALVQPDLHSYIEAVPNAVQRWHDELPPAYGKVLHIPIGDIVRYEINQRYSPDLLFEQSFASLAKFYDALISTVPARELNDDTDYEWLMPLFKVWLRENHLVLSSQKTLDIPGFQIQMYGIADFDGDGTDEYALYLGFGSLSNYMVLRENPTLREGYDIVVVSSDQFRSFNFSNISSGPIIDFNSDGRAEWVIYDDYRGYYESCKYFQVIGWRGGSIGNLIAEKPNTECLSGEVEFVNMDADAAKEIRQVDENYDNWGCLITTEVIWDWDGSQYHLSQENSDQETTLGCAMQRAEPLMWTGDIADAIPLYEKGIQLGWENATGDYFEQAERDEMTQYAKARLVIAYALVGRYEDTRQLQGDLLSEVPTSEMMDTLIQNLSGAPVTSFALCDAAYNVFWRYRHTMTGYNLPSNIIVGRSNYPCCVGDNAPPQPEKAGCDAPRLIDETLSKQKFQVDQTPLEQVIATGIEVESEFHADLNGDGRDDWLIWPVAKVAPILFVQDKNELVTSRPNVRRPNQFSTIETRLAPDGKTIYLVDWIYLDSYTYVSNIDGNFYDISVGWAYCESTNQGNKGDFKLWRLVDTEMAETLTIPLCDQKPISSLFKAGDSGIKAWAFSNTNGQNVFIPATYRWDSYTKTYIAPIPLTNASTNNSHEDIPSSPPVLSEADLFNEMGKISEFLFSDRYHYVLQRIDKALLYHEEGAIPLLTDGLHYYRALALEALNRPDEALTEYLAIYTAAPNSAWGKLAALHLECVNNCPEITQSNP